MIKLRIVSKFFTSRLIRTACCLTYLLSLSTNNCAQISYFQKLEPIENHPLENVKYDSKHDGSKMTVVILADTQGTEITDLIVPYSLLKLADLNVYIVSNQKGNVLLWKGLVLVPHDTINDFPFSFDAVVVPNVFHPEDKSFQKFLANDRIPVLSVCEGAKVIGRSDQFLNHQITTHASSLSQLENEFPRLNWIKGKKYVEDRQLISTAGVASSIEGTLVLISRLVDVKKANFVKQKIGYPHDMIREFYSGEAISILDQLTILWKVTFDDNPEYALHLKSGMNEMDIAITLDVWARTFPSSIAAVSQGYIRTENGLFLAGVKNKSLGTKNLCLRDCETVGKTDTQIGNDQSKEFLLDLHLNQVGKRYGNRFAQVVKRLLDY
ncbi:DJ-1/PfpI family protein [Leptospira ognonensis]|nr:DJ-1/PfpI family protein [Leptospira ognonensis]